MAKGRRKLDVVVAGGGIGGLTLALCLAARGDRVTVLEQAPAFDEVGAGIQLSPNCTRVLLHLGLEAELAAVAFLPEATQFRDWRSGAVITESPLGRSLAERFGAPYYHVHRGDLLAVLVAAAARQPDISLHANARVDGFTDTGDRVAVSARGDVFSGDVLVGADGIHSVVREGLFGADRPRFTGNVAWRALIPADRLPRGLVRPMATVWWGPGRHFVHYFVRGGELVNCVCVVEKQGWHTESWTEHGSREELDADFSGWHDTVRTLIDNMPAGDLYRWALFDRDPMPAWGVGRVTLLGDACHPTLPFLAQGAAMAIEDAAVLSRCLTVSADVATALNRYQDLRRERTAGIQLGSRRNARVFHMAGVQAWFRNRVAARGGQRLVGKLYSYDPLSVVDRAS